MLKVFFTQFSSFQIPPACPLSAYRRSKLSPSNEELQKKQITTEFVLLKSLRTVYDDIAIPMNIRTNEYGKPYILGYPYSFNISHSDDLIICGISDMELGVDVEKTVNPERIDGIVKRFFAPDEQEYISTAEDRPNAFTYIWTLKEAYLKAIGTGGTTPLESFSVLKGIPGYSFHHNTAGDYHYAICVKSDEFPEDIRFEKLT